MVLTEYPAVLNLMECQQISEFPTASNTPAVMLLIKDAQASTQAFSTQQEANEPS